MNEESKGFSEELARLAKEATHEAFLKAREIAGVKGLTLVQKDQLIQLYPDNSWKLIRFLDTGRFA